MIERQLMSDLGFIKNFVISSCDLVQFMPVKRAFGARSRDKNMCSFSSLPVLCIDFYYHNHFDHVFSISLLFNSCIYKSVRLRYIYIYILKHLLIKLNLIKESQSKSHAYNCDTRLRFYLELRYCTF